jgi:hypothetical protein
MAGRVHQKFVHTEWTRSPMALPAAVLTTVRGNGSRILQSGSSVLARVGIRSQVLF